LDPIPQFKATAQLAGFVRGGKSLCYGQP